MRIEGEEMCVLDVQKGREKGGIGGFEYRSVVINIVFQNGFLIGRNYLFICCRNIY